MQDFRKTHAVDGLTLAQCIVDGFEDLDGEYLEGIGARDGKTLLRLGMATAWIFWLDDCFDSRQFDSRRFLARGDLRADGQAHTHNDYCIQRLQSSLGFDERPQSDQRLWLDTINDLIYSFRLNEISSRGEFHWTYAEYIQNGESSSAVVHFVATVSMLYELDMHERLRDLTFQRTLRNLSVSMRLRNDVASIAKERQEGDQANAIVVLDQFMPEDKARSFVAKELEAYERMFLKGLEQMPHGDPFARMMRIMHLASRWFYSEDRERYSVR